MEQKCSSIGNQHPTTQLVWPKNSWFNRKPKKLSHFKSWKMRSSSKAIAAKSQKKLAIRQLDAKICVRCLRNFSKIKYNDLNCISLFFRMNFTHLSKHCCHMLSHLHTRGSICKRPNENTSKNMRRGCHSRKNEGAKMNLW